MSNINLCDLKCGIYTRVSSEQQVEKGWSLEWQEEKLKDIINNEKSTLFSTYVESGISGDEFDKRYSLQRLLSDIKEEKVNCVLVFKVDRLSRDIGIGVQIASILQKHNCFIYSMECGIINLNTAFGQQTYYSLIVNSSTEVKILGERIKEGKRKRASKGFYSNSNGVYGYESYYDTNTGDRLLKVNDYESEYIVNIYDWFLNGISEYKIANKLNDLEIPTKRNGTWKPSTVHSILTNQLYIGKIRYSTRNSNVEIFDGLHTPIIGENKFNLVQELQNKRKINNQKKAPSYTSYYSSIMTCSSCGGKMVSKQTKARDKDSIRYYCKNKCGIKSIEHSNIDNMFDSLISNLYDINISDAMLNEYGNNNDIAYLNSKILRYKNKLSTLENQFNEDCLSLEQYQTQVQKINKKISDLKANLDIIINNNINLNLIDKEIIKLSFNNFSNVWNQLDSKYKKNFVERFISEIRFEEEIKEVILL